MLLKGEGKTLSYYDSAGFCAHDLDDEIVSPRVEFIKFEVLAKKEVVEENRWLSVLLFVEYVCRCMGIRGEGWDVVVESWDCKPLRKGEKKRDIKSGREVLGEIVGSYVKKFPVVVASLDKRCEVALHGLYQSIWSYFVWKEKRKPWRATSKVLMESFLQNQNSNGLAVFVETMTNQELGLEFCYCFLLKRFARDQNSNMALPQRIFAPLPPSSRDNKPSETYASSKLDLEMFAKLTSFRTPFGKFEYTVFAILLYGVASSWVAVNSNKLVLSHTKSLGRTRRRRAIADIRARIDENLGWIESRAHLKHVKVTLAKLRMLMKIIYVRIEENKTDSLEVQVLEV